MVGFDLAYLIVVPLIGSMLSLLGLFRSYIALGFSVLSLFSSLYAFHLTLKGGEPVYQWIGGWVAPLGIGLRLDGLTGFFLLMTALVSFSVSVYAISFFKGGYEREGRFFWFFFFFLWAGLNAFFLSEDLFNLYVASEVLSLTAVVLVALPGYRKAIKAAVNYLILSLLASMFYLFGVAMLYASYGTLSMDLLSERLTGTEEFIYTLFPLSIALAIKAALFPFHFWLPPAHSSTVAPASALLSGLVVKPPAYLILRLWLEVFPKNMSLEYLSWVLGTLGALAVVFGSYYAIRQKTIKMLLAYSTVAQMGYLFLMVPIYYQAQVLHVKTMVLEGFALQALSHALAKASMFLSSGNAMYVARRDELSYMPGFAHSHPFTFFALFFSGATLIGLPLSGGFVAKFLLLKASIQTGFVFQGVIFLIGSLLAAMYVYPIWKESFSSHPKKLYDQPIPRLMELSAFILGFVAFSIGLVSGFLLQGIAGKD
jgi:formate hydrogenlyase subunit 3/multisubunit Na+/H+ antiporter MnhD subunit